MAGTADELAAAVSVYCCCCNRRLMKSSFSWTSSPNHFLLVFIVVVGWTSLLIPSVEAQNKTTALGGCSEIVDIIFIVDSSLSVRETCPQDISTSTFSTSTSPSSVYTPDNWQLILNFLGEVVSRMPVDGDKFRVGLVPFSTSVGTPDVISLDSNHEPGELRRHICAVPFLGGNTNATGALRFVRQMFADIRAAAAETGVTPGKQTAVLLTDGMNNVDSDPVQEARLVKRDGIRLFTVGISDYVDDSVLKEMATGPASYGYVFAPDFSHLNLLVGQMLDRLVCSNPPPTLPCRDSRADIAIILDASGSIIFSNGSTTANYDNWNLMKSFVVTLISQLNVSADDTHIALIRFSFQADVIFTLDRYFTPAEAIQVVQNLSVVASSTNTSGALNVMRTLVFSAAHGDRPDVNNVGIIITDGQSDKPPDTATEAQLAKQAGIRMFAIGLTDRIDAAELTAIASRPLSEHYFNRTSIPLVKTVTSQLLWSVCHNPCPPNEDDCLAAGSAQTNRTTFCAPNKRVTWSVVHGHLLLGLNYATLTDIGSLSQCQDACLQDQLCRSVDYVSSLQQCSISYYTKDDSPDSFRPDSEVDYYQLSCV